MKTKRKKKLAAVRFVFMLAVLAAAAVLIYAVAVNRNDLTAQNILYTLTSLGRHETAAEFTYEDGADSLFADLDGGLLSVSGGHIRIFDGTGAEKVTEIVSLKKPMAVSGGGIAAVYDAGGTFLRVFDGTETLAQEKTENPIISASVNNSGWTALCTEETGYKGSVTVYNQVWKAAYKWYSAENYIVSAVVSPDCRRLAVLTVGQAGSCVVFLRLDSEDEESRFALDGEVILDIQYKDNTAITAVTKNALITVKSSGDEASRYDFSSKTLSAFTLGGDGFAVLVLSENAVGSGGSEVEAVSDGKLLGSATYDGKLTAVSASGDRIAVLRQGSLVTYKKNMAETASFATDTGAGGAIMRGDGSVVVTGAYRSVVFG